MSNQRREFLSGPTRAFAAMRAMLKAWSNGGVAAADAVMLDLTMDLFSTADATKGFAGAAKAIEENTEPATPRLKVDDESAVRRTAATAERHDTNADLLAFIKA